MWTDEIIGGLCNMMLFFVLSGMATNGADVCDFIGGRLHTVNSDPNAPPYDSVREYAYEGAGSVAGSLSSVASGDESDGGADWDELSNWGPVSYTHLTLPTIYSV